MKKKRKKKIERELARKFLPREKRSITRNPFGYAITRLTSSHFWPSRNKPPPLLLTYILLYLQSIYIYILLSRCIRFYDVFVSLVFSSVVRVPVSIQRRQASQLERSLGRDATLSTPRHRADLKKVAAISPRQTHSFQSISYSKVYLRRPTYLDARGLHWIFHLLS